VGVGKLLSVRRELWLCDKTGLKGRQEVGQGESELASGLMCRTKLQWNKERGVSPLEEGRNALNGKVIMHGRRNRGHVLPGEEISPRGSRHQGKIPGGGNRLTVHGRGRGG